MNAILDTPLNDVLLLHSMDRGEQVARTTPGLRTVALVTPDVPRRARRALRSAFTRVTAERGKRWGCGESSGVRSSAG